MTGRVVPSYVNERWSYEVRPFPPERVGEMCFPDENYDYDEMKDSVFLGAYEDEKCVGLAVLQPGFFRYLYRPEGVPGVPGAEDRRAADR